MNNKQFLSNLLDIQHALLKVYEENTLPNRNNKLIFGPLRVKVANILTELYESNNHCFEIVIPIGKFVAFHKPAVELFTELDIMAEYGDFYKIKEDQANQTDKTDEDNIRTTLLRIFGLLCSYSTQLFIHHPNYPAKLDLTKFKQLAESLSLLRKPDDDFKELRKLIEPIQLGIERIMYIPTDQESDALNAWKLFQSFPGNRKHLICERCHLEIFGDIDRDSHVGFRATRFSEISLTHTEDKQEARPEEKQIEKTIIDEPKQKNTLELLEEKIQQAKNTDKPQQLELLRSKQKTLNWVLGFMDERYGVEIELNKQSTLPAKTKFSEFRMQLTLCIDEMQSLGIEMDLSEATNKIIFFRERPLKKIKNRENGQWLLNKIQALYEAYLDKKTHEYFDISFNDNPELVKIFTKDDRLSQYVRETYPGIVCYYMIQTNYERQNEIYPKFIRIGSKITPSPKDESLTSYVSQLMEHAKEVDSSQDYILTGLLQFDWLMNFFQKVQDLRFSESTIGFEDDPSIVQMIKTQSTIKKLIEARCNVQFMSMDNDFALKEDEVISFSVHKKEADSPFNPNMETETKTVA